LHRIPERRKLAHTCPGGSLISSSLVMSLSSALLAAAVLVGALPCPAAVLVENRAKQLRQRSAFRGALVPSTNASGSAFDQDSNATDVELACPNMRRVAFTVPNFQPGGSGLLAGDLTVQGCSNDELNAVEGKTGVVLFLHGRGGAADQYAELYPTSVYLPEDFNIIFLQTPRSDGWMSLDDKYGLNHHWVNSHVIDNMGFLAPILDQLADLYGGHQHVWIAGKSQGAVMAATMALRGTSHLLAGAFIVAGYPPRPLYTDEEGAKGAPASWSASDVEEKKNTKMYFYTGDLDATLPIDQSFCRFNSVVKKWGLDPSNCRFWSKTGYTHGGISPHGNEFHALWHVVKGEVDQVAGVVEVQPESDCKL